MDDNFYEILPGTSINMSASAMILYLGPILSLILTVLLYRKMKRKNPDTSLVSMIYPGIVIFTLSFLFMGIVNIMFTYIGDFITLPTYEASIIDYDSRQEYNSDEQGSVTMHTPKVKFLAEGETVELFTNSSSGAPPVIGDTIKVKYAPGRDTALEVGWKAVLMVVSISSIFFFVLGYTILYIFFYVLDISRDILNKVGVFVLTAIVIPGAMLLFIGVMGWAILQYFMGERDMPLWAVAVCSFFVTILIPSLLGYIKVQFPKKEK